MLTQSKWPGMLLGFGFIGFSLLLGGYLLLVKFHPRVNLNRKIIWILLVPALVCLLLAVTSAVINVRQR
jgi:hypothetical protein